MLFYEFKERHFVGPIFLFRFQRCYIQDNSAALTIQFEVNSLQINIKVESKITYPWILFQCSGKRTVT